MQKCIIVLFIALGFITNIFAEDSFSHKRVKELTQFLDEHQQSFQELERSYAKFLKPKDTAQEFMALLDNQEIPPKLQGFQFLLMLFPEYWFDIITEEKAQVYLKSLNHSNPIIRLSAMLLLEKEKKFLEEYSEEVNDDIVKEMVEEKKKIITILEAQGYVPSTQDQKLLKQYTKDIPAGKDMDSNFSNIIVAFEAADPPVKFYWTYTFGTIVLWSGIDMKQKRKDEIWEKSEPLFLQMEDKGDIYIKGLIATFMLDENRISKLLKNSSNADEFITLGEFFNSRNATLPLNAWPDKKQLEILFNKASGYTQYNMLKLLQETIKSTRAELDYLERYEEK